MSFTLPHLKTGWDVDQAILYEKERIVAIRFGHDWDKKCMQMDEILFNITERVKKFCIIYVVDTTKVPDFNIMYKTIFFYF